MRYGQQIGIAIEGLPKLPNQILGQHWTVRKKNADQWKDAVGWKIKPYKPQRPFSRCVLILRRYSSRQPDIDGLIGSFKPVIDGLVTHGVIKDDNPTVVKALYPEWRYAPEKRGYIEVGIREVIS